MNTTSRILFWEGLVLLVFAGLMLIFFQIQTVYELLFPIVFGGLGLVGLVVALVLFAGEWSKKKSAGETEGLFKTTTKFGANAVLYTVIFLAILIFLNVLGANHTKKFDLTSAKVNTLSDQTVTTLKNLPASAQLEIAGFFKSGESKEFERIAGKYADASPQVKVRVVDPDLHPEEASRYTITQRGAVAVTCTTPKDAPPAPGGVCSGQSNVTMDLSEQGLTTAIVKISAPRGGVVYFLEGHGEVPLEGNEERGYALLKKGLDNENITIKSLMLLKQGEAPPDARVIVIAGPTKKLQPEEIALIEKFLDGGGRVMALIDPQTETGLEPLLAKWGVTVDNDIVVDRQVRLFQGSVLGFDPIVTDYGMHEIVDKFGKNPTLFHEARSLTLDAKGQLPGVIASPLLRTSAESWGETDFSVFQKEGAEPKLDEKLDKKGSLVIGATVERTIGEGDKRKAARLVVIGDADFVNNRYAAQGYNADLFFNSLNWLTGQEAYISLRPNTFAPDVFTMTERDTAMIFFASVFLMPQLVVMLGIGMAIRRRG
jgi:ABC-type uncharacterized transport system involved in gliding motility auxiliary subunit